MKLQLKRFRNYKFLDTFDVTFINVHNLKPFKILIPAVIRAEMDFSFLV